jgi:hypothetical protein
VRQKFFAVRQKFFAVRHGLCRAAKTLCRAFCTFAVRVRTATFFYLNFTILSYMNI